MDNYSIATLILSLIYVTFIIFNNRIGFIFGFIASILWAYTDFAIYNLKFDGFLQIFYALMSIIGYFKWKQNHNDSELIKKLNPMSHLLILIGGFVLAISSVQLLTHFTTSALPYLDAFTTIFSIIATFLLIQRYISNWVYLLVCDLIYIYIYSYQGATLYIIIMIIYCILAVTGFFNWKRISQNRLSSI